MRDTRIVIGVLCTGLLLGGLAACGDSDSEDSTTAAPIGVSAEQSRSKDNPSETNGVVDSTGASSRDDDSSDAAGSPSAAGQSDGDTGTRSEELTAIRRHEAKEASKFVPRQHKDAGGGAAQFIGKTGDNSIQEFGEEASGPDLDEAAATLHNYYDAYAAGNIAAVCSHLSADVIESLETFERNSHNPDDIGCMQILTLEPASAMSERQIFWKEDAAAINVESLRMEGDRGFLIYRGLDNEIFTMNMAKENGRWKVGSLQGLKIS